MSSTAPHPPLDRLAIKLELAELAEGGHYGGDHAPSTRLDPGTWGPPLSEDQREQGEAANLEKAFLARRSVINESLSRTEVARLLDISEQAVTKQIDAGRVIGLKDRGRWAIPSWQIDADTSEGYLPGIDRVSKAFPGGPVTLSRWMTKPSVHLGMRIPRDLLVEERIEEVEAAAKSLTAAGW